MILTKKKPNLYFLTMALTSINYFYLQNNHKKKLNFNKNFTL